MRHNPPHPGGLDDLFPRLRDKSRTLLFNFKSTVGYLDDARWRALGLSKRHWRPSPTDYYRFALSAPHMDGVLAALQSKAQVEAYAKALEAGPLDEEEQRYLINLFELVSGKSELAKSARRK